MPVESAKGRRRGRILGVEGGGEDLEWKSAGRARALVLAAVGQVDSQGPTGESECLAGQGGGLE